MFAVSNIISTVVRSALFSYVVIGNRSRINQETDFLKHRQQNTKTSSCGLNKGFGLKEVFVFSLEKKIKQFIICNYVLSVCNTSTWKSTGEIYLRSYWYCKHNSDRILHYLLCKFGVKGLNG